jgi:hypothetical protein
LPRAPRFPLSSNGPRRTVSRASQCPRESWVATYQSCYTTASESQCIKTQKGCVGKGCWPHPRVRSLSRGGPGGHCRYPKDRVTPHTSIKSRQWLPPPGWGQLWGRHVSPRLWLPPPGSGQLRGRHVPPRLQLSPPGPGQLWGRHMSPRLQHPPSSSGQLRSCHVSRGRAL